MKKLSLKLKIWRQKDSQSRGQFETYPVEGIDTDASFLEMLDILNENLTKEGKDPIAFDHDCREGICGMCGAMVNGKPHGPLGSTTLCQLHMRHFEGIEEIVIEPWRAAAFPVVKDLIVNRSAFDHIMTAGGYVSTKTGSAPEANTVAVPKKNAELAMDAAACIGCGACVAACPNASAMLFTAAKVSHLVLLPQGQVEREERVIKMVEQMDSEGFGNCSNFYECEAACPKDISVSTIARMNSEYSHAKAKE
ncbi:MAG: succinate dehydrogenase/fumarate reductase iron-sulfur subunit [Candidatus Omnitrophica bacterium]|nr:succinate dehydrogenase/fumarate reductase iron-sulfur subunit [Candidatus Omnitrophota bacterium]